QLGYRKVYEFHKQLVLLVKFKDSLQATAERRRKPQSRYPTRNETVGIHNITRKHKIQRTFTAKTKPLSDHVRLVPAAQRLLGSTVGLGQPAIKRRHPPLESGI
ncbi:hypothetical protein M758_9G167900, partial [Ceratodon purpureus]